MIFPDVCETLFAALKEYVKDRRKLLHTETQLFIL
jgi:hypothetical protein